ncbi:MAG: UDP-2,3-diacylglucosamine diphosphatase [Pseudomonadales bacterium]|nr:UDP-2,3-diacylglucosamine diphosphatase [Pseudomonadales bacterium]
MSWLFIADLHLHEEAPALTGAFLSLLEQAQSFERLYILGDLFESWVGDDDDSSWLAPIQSGLKHYVTQGRQLYLQQGNRDFLMGQDFAASISAQLLPEEHVVVLPSGNTALLMHGDSLCTDDVDYQNFRLKVRDPAWQAGILSHPLEQRRMLAHMLRLQSQQANAQKSYDIMDVNADAVTKVMKRNHVHTLIHGHTHRPMVHHESSGHRWVLGDWRDDGTQVLVADAQGLELKTWSATGTPL